MGKRIEQGRLGEHVPSHRIYLIRHGVTDWNKELRYQGSSDVELNDEGLEQARRLGIRLSTVVPTRVVSSPLRRAYRTAEVIMEHNSSSVPIEKAGDAREVSFGDWEGLTVTEVETLHKDKAEFWRKSPFSETPNGGETLDEILARSKRVVDDINASGAPGDVTFVVAHGAILRTLLGLFLKIGDMGILWKMRFDNCCVTLLDIWGKHPSLLLLNDTQHLRTEDGGVIASLKFPV